MKRNKSLAEALDKIYLIKVKNSNNKKSFYGYLCVSLPKILVGRRVKLKLIQDEK